MPYPNAPIIKDRNAVLLERSKTLLQATKELLDKQNKTIYVLDLLCECVNYDGADCDGRCLLEDIEILLEEMEEN